MHDRNAPDAHPISRQKPDDPEPNRDGFDSTLHPANKITTDRSLQALNTVRYPGVIAV
jgi:hypothetical protein